MSDDLMTVTAQQRANALFARDVMWPSVPPENVAPELKFWARKLNGFKRIPAAPHPVRVATCGTIACFGGWIAQNPYFQEQGVIPDVDGMPMMGDGGYNSIWGSSVAMLIFGTADLFDLRHLSEKGEVHEIVTRRLTALIDSTTVLGETK